MLDASMAIQFSNGPVNGLRVLRPVSGKSGYGQENLAEITDLDRFMADLWTREDLRKTTHSINVKSPISAIGKEEIAECYYGLTFGIV